jgi:hypothetical protein
MKMTSLVKSLIILLSAAFGAAYSYLLILAGSFFLGAGHGPEQPLHIATTPFGTGPILWPILIPIALLRTNKWARQAAIFLLLTCYCGVILEACTGRFSPIPRFTTGLERAVFTAIIALHCGLNAVIWLMLIDWKGGHDHLSAKANRI